MNVQMMKFMVVNLLPPERYSSDFKCVVFTHIPIIDVFGISSEWIPSNFTNVNIGLGMV